MFSTTVLLNDQGEVVDRARSFATLDFVRWRCELVRLQSFGELHACFEVGPHYEWMYDLLCEYCVHVEVINAQDFALICQSYKKTDKIDALRLAQGLRRGDLPSIYVPAKIVREHRRLVSTIHFNSQSLVAVKSRLRGLLVTLGLRCPHADILGKASRAWLVERQDGFGACDRLTLEQLVEQGELLVKQRAKLDVLVKQALESYPDASLLQSIPGFGKLTTLAVLCAVVEIGRFDAADKLSSYIGACGKVMQSGQTLKLGPMTKRGNVHVRWLLSQALLHLHRKDPRARKRYMKLLRKKPRGVARGAQVRWLSNVLWHVWSKKQEYRIGGKKAG
jgi:transposase